MIAEACFGYEVALAVAHHQAKALRSCSQRFKCSSKSKFAEDANTGSRIGKAYWR